MNIKIDISSFNNICNNADQLMVYGWDHCKYDYLACTLNNIYKKIVFGHLISSTRNPHFNTTRENRQIEQLPLSQSATYRQMCKTAITDLVLENYKRKDQGLPVIPLVFCCDITGNPYDFNVDTVVSLDPELNIKFTTKELRRCYKMCTAEERDPRLKDIAKIAQETMIFVKLIGDDNSGYTFQKMTPIWNMPGFKEKWKEREAKKQAEKSKSPPKQFPWRTSVLEAVNRYEASKSNPSSA